MVEVDDTTRPYQFVDKTAWTEFRKSFKHIDKRTDVLNCFFIEYTKNPNLFDDILLTSNGITIWD